MDWYFFHLRADDGERVVAELEAQDLDFRVAFDGFIKMTTAFGWDQDQHLETLAEAGRRYQTYALVVRPSDPRLAILTREIGNADAKDGYVYLGLVQASTGSALTAQVRTEACKAHGLTAPMCTPNP